MYNKTIKMQRNLKRLKRRWVSWRLCQKHQIFSWRKKITIHKQKERSGRENQRYAIIKPLKEERYKIKVKKKITLEASPRDSRESTFNKKTLW